MVAAYILFAPLCAVPLGFLVCSTVRVIRHYRDSRDHGKTPYRRYSRTKQLLTSLLTLLNTILLLDVDPMQWPLWDLVTRSTYFALNVLAWTFSSLLVSFDAARQIEQSWFGQRGFWPLSCLSNSLCFVLQLKTSAFLETNSPEEEAYFLISRCVFFVCGILLTTVLSYFAIQHPNDFFWVGSAVTPLSPSLLRRATRKISFSSGKTLSASITAMKAKQGLVYFRILVKIGNSEHSTQRQFSEFRVLHEELRSNFSKDSFPNLDFPTLPNIPSLEIEEKISTLNAYLSALLVPELMTTQLLDFLDINDPFRSELSSQHDQIMRTLGILESNSRHDSFQFALSEQTPHTVVTRALYFKVLIEGWEQTTDPDSHINYLITWQCLHFDHRGKCSRRFNDFYALHQSLKNELNCELPSFPKKNYLAGFGKALDHSALSSRRAALEVYLQTVCNDPAYLSDMTLRFLGCSIPRVDLWRNSSLFADYSLSLPITWEGEIDDQQTHYTVYILTFLRRNWTNGASLQWKVSRRYREFDKLHQQLLNRIKSSAYVQYCAGVNRTSVPNLPALPRKGLVALSSHEEIEQRRKALQGYMLELLKVPNILEAYSLRMFLQEPGGLSPRESLASSSEIVLY